MVLESHAESHTGGRLAARIENTAEGRNTSDCTNNCLRQRIAVNLPGPLLEARGLSVSMIFLGFPDKLGKEYKSRPTLSQERSVLFLREDASFLNKQYY